MVCVHVSLPQDVDADLSRLSAINGEGSEGVCLAGSVWRRRRILRRPSVVKNRDEAICVTVTCNRFVSTHMGDR